MAPENICGRSEFCSPAKEPGLREIGRHVLATRGRSLQPTMGSGMGPFRGDIPLGPLTLCEASASHYFPLISSFLAQIPALKIIRWELGGLY